MIFWVFHVWRNMVWCVVRYMEDVCGVIPDGVMIFKIQLFRDVVIAPVLLWRFGVMDCCDF